jgi:hypothetical protein
MDKYSVPDIERMRAALSRDVTINVEDHLRTYMQNGTTPDELEEHYSRIPPREARNGLVEELPRLFRARY